MHTASEASAPPSLAPHHPHPDPAQCECPDAGADAGGTAAAPAEALDGQGSAHEFAPPAGAPPLHGTCCAGPRARSRSPGPSGAPPCPARSRASLSWVYPCTTGKHVSPSTARSRRRRVQRRQAHRAQWRRAQGDTVACAVPCLWNAQTAPPTVRHPNTQTPQASS